MPQQVLHYPPAKRPSELCTKIFLRYAVFSFNAIFLLTGMTLVGFGMWTLLEKWDLTLLMSPLFSISVYSTVAVGSLILISSIVGCTGVVQERPSSLVAFIVLLVVIFMMELSVGMMSYITYVQVDNATFPKYISEVTLKEWGKQDSTTNAIDNVQMKYKCCGSASYKDWKNNSVIKSLNTTTPDSCCISRVSGCGKIEHPSNIYTKGCASVIEKGLRLNMVLVPALSLGFSVIQIFGVIFSSALTHQISRSRKFVRKKYSY
ncbi:CD151 [Bugula neritina]|uniref:Tetraspanin n=1 Tax=Bugula neritina TaxID=10212 RepID=A0A7J7IWQ1_BUGNE|nr:CD151 [Bugula neritina]